MFDTRTLALELVGTCCCLSIENTYLMRPRSRHHVGPRINIQTYKAVENWILAQSWVLHLSLPAIYLFDRQLNLSFLISNKQWLNAQTFNYGETFNQTITFTPYTYRRISYLWLLYDQLFQNYEKYRQHWNKETWILIALCILCMFMHPRLCIHW